ncbi:MAG: GNAT family N-acetyltransferase [Candidatus Acidiferrum sp.]
MPVLPEGLFANPVWSALHSRHRQFAITRDLACRYPAEVVPFAAVADSSYSAMQQLHAILEPAESVWFAAESYSEFPRIARHETLPCLQMVLPRTISPPDSSVAVVPLSRANADEMVVLTSLAFPGFFRRRTCEMGSYFGIRSDSGELLAMGGERLKLEGFTEISAVCTHPSFRERGYAARLIWEVVRKHRLEGITSFLHVSASNSSAIRLYRHMGFETTRIVTLHRISPKS